tara:strand:+ start:6473 stop:8296 length:1824 start_codon:yes stop_codon:yes gene_type:complete
MTETPRWVRDFRRFLPLRSQFVLSGNVRDRYPIWINGQPILVRLDEYLRWILAEAGIHQTIAFDPVTGFNIPTSYTNDTDDSYTYFGDLGLQFDENGVSAASQQKFFETLPGLIRNGDKPTAVIADFAARMLVRPDHLSAAEQTGFTSALVLAHRAVPKPHPETGKAVFNPTVWIIEKEGDLPDWLTVDNPRLRHISIPKPDFQQRKEIAPVLIATVPGGADLDPPTLAEMATRFAETTDGMRIADLHGISVLMSSEGIHGRNVDDAVRRYKLGVTEDPWLKIDRDRLRGAEAFIRDRVKGQNQAVRHMLDIVTRAATGVGGARGGRPRGVAFLAGPTGVGKTELAKTITQLLFGDERAYIRFDMSEFSAEHADQRLIGAPPGYVGYDTGGELTNAVRERPFAVVLFDEIEKAHPRILDKFLQVLDDGVLTSGRGERVYFSEALIIFTSNLGVSAVGADGERRVNITQADTHEEMSLKLRTEIERHFKLEIGRPELLNRIGENIIVFDYIRPALAVEIYEMLLDGVIKDIGRNQAIKIELTPEARGSLQALCISDLSNGGRGIRNAIEANFVNPLARLVFEADVQPGQHVFITQVIQDEAGVRLEAS